MRIIAQVDGFDGGEDARKQPERPSLSLELSHFYLPVGSSKTEFAKPCDDLAV